MIKIEAMTVKHREEVLDMMREFYASSAVYTNGSEEIFLSDIENCINGSPYVEGYVFTEDNNIVGYAMAAKSFSTEFGKQCIWLEDIYIKTEYRRRGIGTRFIEFIENKYADAVFRLEAEEDNEAAISAYRKNGFKVLPYMEMKK